MAFRIMRYYDNVFKRAGLVRLAQSLGRHPEKLTPKEQLLSALYKLRPRRFSSELIRIGSSGDGGYLLPTEVSEVEFVISPGVGNSVEFELDMLKRFGTSSILIDKSVNKNPDWPPEFTFESRYLGARNQQEFLDLGGIIDKYTLSRKKILLQMDIEGFEYEVLMRSSKETLNSFDYIVLELHDLNFWIRSELFNRFFLPAIENLFQDFTPIHFHANSAGGTTRIYGVTFPNTVELTLVSQTHAGIQDGYALLPHTLDKKNTNLPEIQMPFEEISKALTC